MFKKYTLITLLFTAMVFGAGNVHAENDNSSSYNFESRLGIITQLMNIMDRHPEFESIIKPFINDYISEILESIEEFKNHGQMISTSVKERNEIRKEIKNVKSHDDDDDDQDEDDDEDEDRDVEFSLDTLVSIEAEQYEGIDGKWKVELSFEDGNEDEDVEFYLYDIEDDNDLVSEIKEYMDDELDIDISLDDVEDMIDIDND